MTYSRKPMRRLAVLVLVAAGLAVGACAPVKGAAPVCRIPCAQEIADAVNADRRASGLSAVGWDADLAAMATGWARQATEQDPHRSGSPPLAVSERFLSVRENVWGPYRSMCVDAAEVQATFMGSPGHRVNVLDPDIDLLGVGVVARGDHVWIVQNFGNLR